MNKAKIYKNSKDEWYTPKYIVDYFAEICGGFDLDPATTKLQAKELDIPMYCDKDCDGLSKDWYGNVWLNPPFSNKSDWIKKAREEVDKGNCRVFLLLPSALETKAFHKYILGRSKMYIPNKRIKFIDSSDTHTHTTPPFTSVIFELTKEQNNTYEVFEI